jgi:hypothetical protein
MTSWIVELERLEKLNQNAMREQSECIAFTAIYVNFNNEIEFVKNGTISLEKCTISKERLIKIISKYTHQTERSKFLCKEISIFHVSVEPEKIVHFSQIPLDEPFMKTYFRTLPIVDDIIIEPSIFIFHPINRIFFTFIEVISRSCLKSNSSIIGKDTKRVRIQLPRTTRKHQV